MRKFTKIGLLMVVAAALLTSDANAGLFGRRAYRYNRSRPVATQQIGVRAEGHTEATGTGTVVDGR